MSENKGSAATRAKQKYNAANYDRLYPVVPKGKKAEIEAAATAVNESINEYITKAIDQRMERDRQM